MRSGFCGLSGLVTLPGARRDRLLLRSFVMSPKEIVKYYVRCTAKICRGIPKIPHLQKVAQTTDPAIQATSTAGHEILRDTDAQPILAADVFCGPAHGGDSAVRTGTKARGSAMPIVIQQKNNRSGKIEQVFQADWRAPPMLPLLHYEWLQGRNFFQNGNPPS